MVATTRAPLGARVKQRLSQKKQGISRAFRGVASVLKRGSVISAVAGTAFFGSMFVQNDLNAPIKQPTTPIIHADNAAIRTIVAPGKADRLEVKIVGRVDGVSGTTELPAYTARQPRATDLQINTVKTFAVDARGNAIVPASVTTDKRVIQGAVSPVVNEALVTTAALETSVQPVAEPDKIKPVIKAALAPVAEVIAEPLSLLPNSWRTYIKTDTQKGIFNATYTAATRVGVSPFYMQLMTRAESGHRPIGTTLSSAAGPCQFIDSTWLYVLKTYGEQHGYKEFADAIVLRRGEYSVPDAKKRVTVMALRMNPRAAALMAAEYSRENHAIIRDAFPKLNITESHLYAAHFFGGGDVVKFIRNLQKTPNAIAAPDFKKPAAANPGIFTIKLKNGTRIDRTYAQVFSTFKVKMATDWRLEVPLVTEQKLDQDVQTVSLADIKVDSKIHTTTTLSAKKRAALKAKLGTRSEETATVSLWTVFKNNAEATKPHQLPKRVKHRAAVHAPAI